MKTYQFETEILEDGSMPTPDLKRFVYHKVKVSIELDEPSPKKKKKITADEFIEKWSGFFSGTDVEDAKYQYLIEKHK